MGRLSVSHCLLPFETRFIVASFADHISNLFFSFARIDNQGRSSSKPEETVLDVPPVEGDGPPLIDDGYNIGLEFPIGGDTAGPPHVVYFEGCIRRLPLFPHGAVRMIPGHAGQQAELATETRILLKKLSHASKQTPSIFFIQVENLATVEVTVPFDGD